MHCSGQYEAVTCSVKCWSKIKRVLNYLKTTAGRRALAPTSNKSLKKDEKKPEEG